MAELLRGAPILPGNTEIEQVDLIFALCGSPTTDTWPGGPNLPLWDTFCNVDEDDSSVKERSLTGALLGVRCGSASDLVDAILQCDPSSRLSASDALQRPYCRDAPRPSELGALDGESSLELEVRKRRREKKGAVRREETRFGITRCRGARRPLALARAEQGPSVINTLDVEASGRSAA